ncbi:MAG: DegT/DnrJ/EryC1/StrS family aminotransferase [Rhodospirillaceae bacterium]|nr:DegT/DnrJ/EryC1/StrS family aminotransferase [Rhodospirillaceae bacterium]
MLDALFTGLARGRDDRLRDSRQITSRMDEVQAAMLRIKLRHLDAWLDERRRIASLYAAQLPAGGRPVASGDECAAAEGGIVVRFGAEPAVLPRAARRRSAANLRADHCVAGAAPMAASNVRR